MVIMWLSAGARAARGRRGAGGAGVADGGRGDGGQLTGARLVGLVVVRRSGGDMIMHHISSARISCFFTTAEWVLACGIIVASCAAAPTALP